MLQICLPMKRIFKHSLFANVILDVMIIGEIVLSIGFGACVYIAKGELTTLTDKSIKDNITAMQSYIDTQLLRVEDATFSLLSWTFGGTVRDASGNAFVVIDPATFTMPTEDECFRFLEHFLECNPMIVGAAVAFEPFLYQSADNKYGFAADVVKVDGHLNKRNLGMDLDYRQLDWYTGPRDCDMPYWSHPYREVLGGALVSSYCVPLHGIGDRFIGVLAVDINTADFNSRCRDILPYPDAEVAIADRTFRFLAHTDSNYIMKWVGDIPKYASYSDADDSVKIKMLNHESGNCTVNKGKPNEAFFYFAPIARTGWTLTIECPTDEVYGPLRRMKISNAIISLFSIIFMILCFVFIFRKVQKSSSEKAVIERDLKIASSIQMGMIPKLYPAFPERKELDVYGFLKPAKAVGGDLYDYYIRDNKFIFCIGDVSGKGVPASLFMAVVRSMFRAVSQHTFNTSHIVSELNATTTQGNDHNMFCTMFVGVLDLETGELEYCNAGHNAPVFRRMKGGDVTVDFIKPKTNLAIGIMPGFEYQSESTVLAPGEAVFMYTDGVTEAENSTKQLFGDAATLATLAQARKRNCLTVKEYIDFVYNALQAYSQGVEQSDDITMLALEYKGPAASEETTK